jgi:hypothetical protein
MAEEKPAQTATLGHIDVKDLKDVEEWQVFETAAKEAQKANKAHEAAKKAMRNKFKEAMKLAPDTEIEFSRTGDKVTVIKILEKKRSERAKAGDLSELFRSAPRIVKK